MENAFLNTKKKRLTHRIKKRRKKEEDNHKEIRKWRTPKRMSLFVCLFKKKKKSNQRYLNKKKTMWDEIKEKDKDNKVRKPNINQIQESKYWMTPYKKKLNLL